MHQLSHKYKFLALQLWQNNFRRHQQNDLLIREVNAKLLEH